MKKVVFILVVSGYAVCLVGALWPAPIALFPTEAYVGLSCCSLAVLLCVSKPQRWLLLAALLVGLIGVFISRRGNQTLPVVGPTWVHWSASAGGNGHWYAFTPSATNWLAAQDTAVSWGGNLVVIHNPSEQDFINAKLLTGAFDDQCVWIGLLRSASNRTLPSRVELAMQDLGILHSKSAPATPPGPAAAAAFEWVTGEPLSYNNWKPGEPNNAAPGEPYVAINWAYAAGRPDANKGDWNDTPLNGTTHYGGNTDGPYFGLVERESDPNQQPILTAAQLRLATWVWLLLAAALAWVSYKKGIRPRGEPGMRD